MAPPNAALAALAAPLLLLLLLLPAQLRVDGQAPHACPLYLRRSRVSGGGTGVFAGSTISLGGFIESCPSIVVPKAAAVSCALTNYVYAHNDTHDTVVLGVGMMFNHHPEPHVHNVWAGVGTIGRNEPAVDDGVHCDKREPLCDTAFFATGRAALQDEEIYGFYGGGQSWFDSRGLTFSQPAADERRLSPTMGEAVPGCAGSDVTITEWRAHATRGYVAGDVVEVCPGLVLRSSGYMDTELESLVLPLFDKFGGGRHGLLLLGKGALYPLSRGRAADTRSVWQSAKSGDWPSEVSNLEASWWPSPPDSEAFQSDAHNANSGVFVSFTATKRILPGERLIYDVEAWPPEYPINYKDL